MEQLVDGSGDCLSVAVTSDEDLELEVSIHTRCGNVNGGFAHALLGVEQAKRLEGTVRAVYDIKTFGQQKARKCKDRNPLNFGTNGYLIVSDSLDENGNLVLKMPMTRDAVAIGEQTTWLDEKDALKLVAHITKLFKIKQRQQRSDLDLSGLIKGF